MGVNGCRAMAAGQDRTACLACMHKQARDATFEPDGECKVCGNKDLEPNATLTTDEYYKTAIRYAIFDQILRRKDNKYTSFSSVSAQAFNIPLDFMERFMEEVADWGRLWGGACAGKTFQGWEKGQAETVITDNSYIVTIGSSPSRPSWPSWPSSAWPSWLLLLRLLLRPSLS